MKSNLNKTTVTTLRNALLTATVAGVISGGSATAASACKGLESKACSNNASCSWVEGYERKDGRKVKSFCRSKSRGSKQAVKLNHGAEQKAG